MRMILHVLLLLVFINRMEAQWTKCQTLVSETLYSIYADTTGLVLVGGSDGVLLKSTDFGNNLRIVNTNNTYVVEKIVKINDSLLIAQISKNLYYSTDNGETWINNQSPKFNISGLDLINGNLYVFPWAYNGAPPDIYKSSDNGKTWNFINKIPTTIALSKFYMVNDSCWYAIGDQGLLMFTDDYGANWVKQARGVTTVPFQDILKINDTIAITDGPSLFATFYKKDSCLVIKNNNWYNGGEITYSGKYWYNNSQLGVDYSSSIFKWEGKKPAMPSTIGRLNRIFWINKTGLGFALYGNNLYKTTNHGESITSIEIEEENDLPNIDFKYYNFLGQEVSPRANQMLLRINVYTGKTEKVFFEN
jgi:hypothetical protein